MIESKGGVAVQDMPTGGPPLPFFNRFERERMVKRYQDIAENQTGLGQLFTIMFSAESIIEDVATLLQALKIAETERDEAQAQLATAKEYGNQRKTDCLVFIERELKTAEERDLATAQNAHDALDIDQLKRDLAASQQKVQGLEATIEWYKCTQPC